MATFIEHLQNLSYLLGETSVPSSGIDDRKRFVNIVRRDIYARRDWEWAKKNATITLADYKADLPSDYRQGGLIDARIVQAGISNDKQFELISYADRDNYASDTYVCWVTGNDVDGYELNSNQETGSVAIRYIQQAEELTGNDDTCPIPLPEAVAKGALVYVRKSENPMAETQIEEAEYEKAIMKMNRLQMQDGPAKRFRSILESRGRRIGE
jgi:hypothetical protein